ncbi:MAG: sigma 54-dependent Fis family transcriptional regulator [Deltaproteobacteria bacterium]|nr:sigma 54-dependent Fis family transcriptional regulator [Deltaproteobacteria bacterium]
MPVDDLRSGTWVTYIGGRASSARLRRCRVEIMSGADAGLVRDIEASVIRIGARRGNDVQLSDSKVSGLHCEIRLDDRGYRLRDLDSTNGTYVAGLRINDVYVAPGALIAVGGTRLKFDPLGDSIEIELSDTDRFGGMIGRSVKMRELFARLEKLAKSDTTVLVTGETGAGKELVAEALHEHSPREKGPFVVLDCGSIPPNLIESELFGHERGAFTGATNSYAGAFERAHGGTVFLDEIGELPLGMQPKLLRVLERKEVRRVGGTKTLEVDLRVVAATNRDLGVEVNRGRFREDLYYRLAVARVHVPPLRERKDDLPVLIEHILSTTPGGELASIAQETIDLMMKHDWPGNVRELRNVIERAVLLAEAPDSEDSLRRTPQAPKSDSPVTVTPSQTATSTDASMTVPVDVTVPFKHAKQNVISEFEKRYISRLLAQHDGNISAAARAAGIDRMSIHKMLHRLGLANPGRD